jgi:hypothetical protein
VQSGVALYAAVVACISDVVTGVLGAAGAAGVGHEVFGVFLALCISCGWPADLGTAATYIC